MMAHVGKAVDSIYDFQLSELLGKGAMGIVWRARRKNTNERYAIKVIEKQSVEDIDSVIAEREILAEMNHPFVVQMYWAFQDEKRVYFVLEYANGGDLHSVIQNFYPDGMDEDRVRFYIVEILLAVEYLHSKDIVVRDLKPSNCLTTEAGHVKLTDFGHSLRLAKQKDNNSAEEEDFGDEDEDSNCVGTPGQYVL
jgi:microtubule-associated serine/threonine kinase